MKKKIKENYDLKFVGSDDTLKSKIEQILATYDNRIRQLVLDALEILKKNTSYYSTNQQGLSKSQWASILEVAFKRLYRTIGGTEVKSYADQINLAIDFQFFTNIVEDVAKKFTCCVSVTNENRYIWGASRNEVKESVSDRPSINLRIERVLNTLDKETQTRVLDALEILKSAGASGLSVSDWAAKIKQIHNDQEFSMSDLLKMTVKSFPFAVKRIADKTYGWDDSDRSVKNELSPEAQSVMQSQLSLAKVAMDAMQSLGTFTVSSLAMKMEDDTGYPIGILLDYAKHIIAQFEGDTIEKISTNEYRIKPKTQKNASDHVQALKDLMRRAGIDKKD
jgi:hypothetical protein